MAPWEKAFDTRSDLSLVPGTNITEREPVTASCLWPARACY